MRWGDCCVKRLTMGLPIIAMTLPDQRQLNHLHYGSGHLHQLNLNGRLICDFERDQLHEEVLRTQGSLLTRTRYDRSGRLSQKALHYRSADREELPLLNKRYQYDASDNLIIERLTQTQRRGGSDPRQSLPDDGLLGRFLGQSHGKSVEGNEHCTHNPELHREPYNYDAAATSAHRWLRQVLLEYASQLQPMA